MIPKKFLCKTGNYVVPINDTKLQVKVVDTNAGIDQVISDKFNAASCNIIGLDYKTAVTPNSTRSYGFLVLCSLDGGVPYCLVIHLGYLYSYNYPKSLKSLLTNPDICFVTEFSSAKLLPKNDCYLSNCYSSIPFIEVGDLASRVLNKPDLKGLSSAQIASRLGLSSLEFSKSSQIQVEQENTRVLTDEQVKMAVLDAYASAKIADTLLYSRFPALPNKLGNTSIKIKIEN